MAGLGAYLRYNIFMIYFEPTYPEDFEHFRELRKSVIREHVDRQGIVWDEAQEDVYHRKLFNEEGLRRILFDGTLVGYIGVREEAGVINVGRFCIEPKFQNRGIGTAVMKIIMSEPDIVGKEISFAVIAANPARRLYERLGFFPVNPCEINGLISYSSVSRLAKSALIFDCDGVVIDSMGLHNEVEMKYYKSFSVHVAGEELSNRFAGVPQDEVLRILSDETGREFPLDAEAQIDKLKEETMKNRLKAIPGIYEALEALKDVPKCIASSTRLAGVRHTLGIVGLRDVFAPNIFCTEMVARGKPFPDLFLYAAERMGHAPDQCVVIEDSVAGVHAAKAAGMWALGFTGGSHTYKEHTQNLKNAGADRVFSDMLKLPKILGQRNLIIESL